MPEIKLKIDHLALDHDNPRITHSEGQQEALQKIIKDQGNKLVKLAESVVERGLNPMDRLLVLRLNQSPKRYISLEGIGAFAKTRSKSSPRARRHTMRTGRYRMTENVRNLIRLPVGSACKQRSSVGKPEVLDAAHL